VAEGKLDHIKAVQDLLDNAKECIPKETRGLIRDVQIKEGMKRCEGYVKAALAVIQTMK